MAPTHSAPSRIAARPGPRAIEVWFGIVERQAHRRDTFGNVRELTTAIKTFIAG